MGTQDFPHMSSGRTAKGLLERAAETFDLGGALRGTNLPPLDIPADLFPPEKPVAAPVRPAPPSGLVPVDDEVKPMAIPTARARDWSGPLQMLDRAAMAEAGYLLPDAPVTGLAEEFRIVKRELLNRMRGTRQQEAVPNGNVILVSSAHQGEGKTWCSINLALSLSAEKDIEVLLVDADVAKPGVTQALGLSGDKGLMDLLADPSLKVEDLVIRTEIPSLSVLPAGAGSHSDAEYLASGRTEALISALVAGRPDRVVLFDSPPLLAASAASVLAAHVGQTLLVVRADRTTETALRDAADLLKGCAHISLLLNGVKFSASGRRFGSYYGKDDAR